MVTIARFPFYPVYFWAYHDRKSLRYGCETTVGVRNAFTSDKTRLVNTVGIALATKALHMVH